MSASEYIIKLRDKVGNIPIMLPCVAAVILNQENELLLQQKKDGSWSLPAGMIEPGESPYQALVREVKEETGLMVMESEVIGVFGGEAFQFVYPNGDQVDYTVVMFRCRAAMANSKDPLDSETLRLQYFAKHTMPELALPYPKSVLFGEESSCFVSGCVTS